MVSNFHMKGILQWSMLEIYPGEYSVVQVYNSDGISPAFFQV